MRGISWWGLLQAWLGARWARSNFGVPVAVGLSLLFVALVSYVQHHIAAWQASVGIVQQGWARLIFQSLDALWLLPVLVLVVGCFWPKPEQRPQAALTLAVAAMLVLTVALTLFLGMNVYLTSFQVADGLGN